MQILYEYEIRSVSARTLVGEFGSDPFAVTTRVEKTLELGRFAVGHAVTFAPTSEAVSLGLIVAHHAHGIGAGQMIRFAFSLTSLSSLFHFEHHTVPKQQHL